MEMEECYRLWLKCDQVLLKKYKATLSFWKEHEENMERLADPNVYDGIYFDFRDDNAGDRQYILMKIREIKRRRRYLKSKLRVPPDVSKDDAVRCVCGKPLEWKQDRCSYCGRYIDWHEFVRGIDDI